MAVIKVGDLDDEIQEWLRKYWKYSGKLYWDELVDKDLVLEKIEETDPLLFDQIKNPEKYKISRWELLDV